MSELEIQKELHQKEIDEFEARFYRPQSGSSNWYLGPDFNDAATIHDVTIIKRLQHERNPYTGKYELVLVVVKQDDERKIYRLVTDNKLLREIVETIVADLKQLERKGLSLDLSDVFIRDLISLITEFRGNMTQYSSEKFNKIVV